MSKRTSATKCSIALLVGCVCLLTAATACKKADPNAEKVAELEQQLKATQDQLAAAQPPAGSTPEAAAVEAAAPPIAGAPPTAATPATAATPGVTTTATVPKTATSTTPASSAAATPAPPSKAAAAEPKPVVLTPLEVTIPAGTLIAARTTTEVSTKTLLNGSAFDSLLEQPLTIKGTTVARKGAHVTVVVVSSDPGGKVKGVASLEVTARSLEGLKSSSIALSTDTYTTEAGSTKKKDVKRAGIMTGAGAVIGAIAGGGKGAAIGAGVGAGAGVGTAMATRGDPAVIPAETLLEFRLTSPVTISVPR